MTHKRPQPGSKSPKLDVPAVGGGTIDLHTRPGEHSAMIIFYRGLHCPKCREQLQEVDRNITEFKQRGINVVAVSMDDAGRAEKARDEWNLSEGMKIGYGLSDADARGWGLYLSRAEFDDEPEEFCEPGIFLVNADNDIYAGWIQTMPFARPRCEDIIAAIDFVRDKDYPARGKAA